MASITDQTRWRRVLNHVAADLKAVIDIAAGQSVEVTQDTPADLKALVTPANLRGIIPNPITATRISKAGPAAGVVITEFYEVPEDTILFIDCSWISVSAAVAASRRSYLYIRNVGDAVVINIMNELLNAAGQSSNSLYHCPALVVPAGYDICVEGDSAGILVDAGFHGWLEDV